MGYYRGLHYQEFHVSPIDIIYSSFYEDFYDRGVRGRSHPRDDLSDQKIKTLEFDGNLKPENYLDLVQANERIFELKKHIDEKAFKLAILNMQGHASLWYDNLKKNQAREAKAKIKP